MKSGSVGGPGLRGRARLRHDRPNGRARHERADAGLARDGADGTRPRYHNLTLLPDGTVLASGGGARSDGVDLTKSVLPAEIWNPDTETWTTVDSLTNGRLYHSTALLLPDGRVLMAGGGALSGAHRIS